MQMHRLIIATENLVKRMKDSLFKEKCSKVCVVGVKIENWDEKVGQKVSQEW